MIEIDGAAGRWALALSKVCPRAVERSTLRGRDLRRRRGRSRRRRRPHGLPGLVQSALHVGPHGRRDGVQNQPEPAAELLAPSGQPLVA